ncbi:heavy-metal-associated domain-containing protein [Noviherbaspirillum sp. ST9]|uniref:heavy-metal-associated domain-containing protein n=1 Tax=Noviherbaspirillum sp. ST9 TaxID=3401606 RepID=UPI003B58A13A
MTCGGCAARVTRAIQALDESAKVKVDLPRKVVLVESELDGGTLAHVVTEAGYPARTSG